ncbi:aldo-keto reductase family 1 member B1 isoform X1 [Anopheles cruzii]|uniref:aldo-keto reductase family 1 member B1 isoform X1 n=1 Tax=Anopheles cruzii TaxID=68878 RepID=UPI0022EC2DB5|nr:aldo-keto reductase family 1 member B1 isoform X1 [Anopheles cruzii]
MATKKGTVPMVKLNNGREMPALGLGTWLSKEGEGVAALKTAIDAGYRHIDTAYFYQNETEVGQAVRDKIAEGVVQREDMFITTKLWNTFHDPSHVEEAFRRSLENLNLDYIDLYLMHTPMSYRFKGWFADDLMPYDADGKLELTEVDFVATWKAMEKLLKTGKVRSLGVSNFNSEQIARLLAECEIKPVTNQVECNPGLNQRKLTAFCKERDVTITAYSPLGRPNYYEKDPENVPKPALDDPRVAEIAKKYGKTPGQVVLRYLFELGTIPIPKSANEARLRQNINIFDFKLTKEEMAVMDTFHTGKRSVPFSLCVKSKYFPFNIEF